MSDIRDFKKIADEAMWDINVTEKMKNEVLKRCSEKQRVSMPVLRIAATAACGLLVAGMLYFTGALRQVSPDNPGNIDDYQQPGIFSVGDDRENDPGNSDIGIKSATGLDTNPGTGSDMGIMSGQPVQWQPESLDEAGHSFGEGFLMPSHIPEGYGLSGIHASGKEMGQADMIILSYSSDERLIDITEEKTEMTGDFSGFEEVDINGVRGYVMSDNYGAETYYTQLFWTDDGIMYTISGALTREEAIEIARSMNNSN